VAIRHHTSIFITLTQKTQTEQRLHNGFTRSVCCATTNNHIIYVHSSGGSSR